MNENVHYVYLHLKADTNEVFYVGKGFKMRAYSDQRTKWWKNTVSKHGFQVEFVAQNLTEEDASRIERETIARYGRKDQGKGSLINLTDGGEGATGRIFTEETRRRMSENRRGKRNGSRVSRKEKRSPKIYVRKHPDGYSPTQETREKIREKLKGRVTPDSTREKQRDALSGRKKLVEECPVCHKVGGAPAMKRWHFNNCKLKK